MITIKSSRFLLILLILNAAFSSVFSQDVDYIYSDTGELLEINKGIEVFIDKSKQLEINDIVKKNFIVNNAETPNFGITTDKIWMRLKIHNQTDENDLFLLIAQPSLD